jgi:hypothetical protein
MPKNPKKRPQDVHRASIFRRCSGTFIVQAFYPQKWASRAHFSGKDFDNFDAFLRAFSSVLLLKNVYKII